MSYKDVQMNIYSLEIKDKDDGVAYQFLLTYDEIMNLSNMPYKVIGSGHPGQPSHSRFDNAKFDAYRLGEDFHIMYDNGSDNHKGSIFPFTKYSEIEQILKSASLKIYNKSSISVGRTVSRSR